MSIFFELSTLDIYEYNGEKKRFRQLIMEKAYVMRPSVKLPHIL